MRVLRMREGGLRPIERFNSHGFRLARIMAGPLDLHLSLARLDVGGEIGRHEAASEQLLLVVAGSAVVRGSDGEAAVLEEGDAVLFARGEMHDARSASGMSAVIAEGDGLTAALRS